MWGSLFQRWWGLAYARGGALAGSCGDAYRSVDGRRVPSPTPQLQGREQTERGASVTWLTIRYTGAGFAPRRAEIELAESVAFMNDSDDDFWPTSNIHPTHQIYPELDAKRPVPPGETWLFTFDEPGFWRYHNHLSSPQGGLVVVSGDAAGPLTGRLPLSSSRWT